jgi:hypothetical protein
MLDTEVAGWAVSDLGSYQERWSGAAGGTVWTATTTGASGWILPDGCMDVIWDGEQLLVAGPDTVAHLSEAPEGTRYAAVRFDSGVGPAAAGLVHSKASAARGDPLGADQSGSNDVTVATPPINSRKPPGPPAPTDPRPR